MVMGNDLLATLQDQAAEHQYYDTAPPMACPRCGEPMRPGPPDDVGVLYCDFDFFKYPDDWNPATMSGM